MQQAGMVFIANMLFVVSMVLVINLTICAAVQHGFELLLRSSKPGGGGPRPRANRYGGPTAKIFRLPANNRCQIFCDKFFIF